MATTVKARKPKKTDHAEIRSLCPKDSYVRLSEVKPCPENELLYHRIREDDPDIIALAQSIATHGVKDPLVLTEDNYLLSGHRRLVASKLAGLDSVPVRFEPICRGDGLTPDDPRVLTFLREFNRQRVKTFDEVVREESLTVDPGEAHRVLKEHRTRRASVRVETVKIRGEKKRKGFSKAKKPMLAAVCKIIDELQEFWPLTDRQVHYNMLNVPGLLKNSRRPDSLYANDLKSYKDLTDLLTRARLFGDIPFEAIGDSTRPFVSWRTWNSVGPFLNSQLEKTLQGYSRNLLQSQPNWIEIVGEKNTIQNIIEPVASEFCIPYTLGRGYSSLDPRHHMNVRFRNSGKEKLIVLVLSDFDPEGEDIPHSFARSMRDDFGVDDIEAIKVALTEAQVNALDLPTKIEAKQTSSRYARFVREHGQHVFELEAIPPTRLQEMLREAINNVLDLEAFNSELEREEQDATRLESLRRTLVASLSKITSEWGAT
jgi:hypothetical protein